MERLPLLVFGTVAVVGAGPIGLGTALFARIAGFFVTLLDLSAERLLFAERELGLPGLLGSADGSAEVVRSATGGDGFDIVFDASGNSRSMGSAGTSTRSLPEMAVAPASLRVTTSVCTDLAR